MLLSFGMEKKFWAEAAATAIKLMNKCPSSAIKGDTPDFKWYGKHGGYTGINIFGCQAYAHVKQSKLDARALKCVLLGYQSGVKGYRLWCLEPGKQKVIVSRDVVFSESVMSLKKKKDIEVTTVSVEPVTISERESDVLAQGGADGSDEDEVTQGESNQEPEDLSEYLLARDRARRKDVKSPARYADSEMLYFALCVG